MQKEMLTNGNWTTRLIDQTVGNQWLRCCPRKIKECKRSETFMVSTTSRCTNKFSVILPQRISSKVLDYNNAVRMKLVCAVK